jgi:hypothetical protein
MNRKTIWRTARVSICLFAGVLLAVHAASAPAWATFPTPQQIKCEWKKHRKVGRYQACMQNAVVAKVKNPAFDLDAAKAACAATFETAWELQETNAADAGEECLDGAGHFDEVRALLDAPADRLEARLAGTRWVDNGDGTATDSTTGLQWELKTDDGSVHDKDNTYTWGSTTAPYPPNGTAFTDFIARLNGSADGVCFTGHCDWRLPTIGELLSIVDQSVPGCGTGAAACTTIPGLTVPSYYWSSSTWLDLQSALGVHFIGGSTFAGTKMISDYVRAVRGGS